MTKLIATHPYSMYGGELDLEDWQGKLDKLKEEIAVRLNDPYLFGLLDSLTEYAGCADA